MVERGRARVVFQLHTGAERPRLLRLDLSDGPAMVTVLALRLRNAAGTLLARCSGSGQHSKRSQCVA